jgi:phage-related minor tail protein
MTYTDYQNQLATEHQSTLNTLNAKGTDVDAQTANVQGEAALTAQEDKWKAQQETLVGGFDSAIHEFIASSKDAAEQMRSLVTTTLHSLNEQLINGMMGKGTNFKQFGSDVFKNVANTSLQKGEGALMGMIPGMGKMGTKSNPMHVIMDGAGAAGKAAGAIAGAVGGATTAATSKVGSVFGSMLSSILPMLADGGFMNGPAIVGENGPELFNPSVPGQIIPNYKLNTGSGSGDIHFHPGAIDARGSSDPAAVEAAVQRGIRAAAPHIMAGSVHANRETQKRRPSRAA